MKQSCATKYVGLGVVVAGVVYAYPAMSKNTEFEASLDDSQKQIWGRIKMERYVIFVVSLTISMLTAIYATKSQVVRTVIALVMTTLLYKFLPKSTYMKEHVTPTQLELMKQKPKEMNYFYVLGMVWVVAIALFSFPL